MQKICLLLICAGLLAACNGAPSTSTPSSSVTNASSTPEAQSSAAVSSTPPQSSASTVSSSAQSSTSVVLVDQCNTTAQCIDTYGPTASDCKNSASDTSICLCGSNRCDAIGNTPSSSIMASSVASQGTSSSVSVSSVPAVGDCEGEVMLGEELYSNLLCINCHGSVPQGSSTIWKGPVASTVGIDLYDSQNNGYQPTNGDSATPVDLNLIQFITQYMPSKASGTDLLEAERVVAYLTHTAGNPISPWCPGTPWPHGGGNGESSSANSSSSSSSPNTTPVFKQKYKTLCAGCHGTEGKGVTNLGPEIEHPTVDYALWLTRNGRSHPNYGAAMPAYTKSQLSDAELNAILNWLNDAPQPTTGEGVYQDYCSHCHADNGRGTAGHNAKGRSVSVLTTHIRNGHNLTNFGTRNKYMPKWNSNEITTEQIKKLQSYTN